MTLYSHRLACSDLTPDSSGPVSMLADTLYSLATRFHLIPTAGHDIEAVYAQMPGSARAEAERRR